LSNQGVEVEIYGERYTIRGGDDAQHVRQVADDVDRRMRELALNMRTATPTKIAVLAALHLAHELSQVRAHQQEKEADLDRRTFGLLEAIEAELGTARSR
jgi:cell division protein ZapA